ncbi:MAG: tryptophan synthase subunit alpha [Candidatus Riflebacteria bacterium]|nr:tryptophan synthase subunit alpha [Candidatus Riflebacteria bacterium]
MTRSIRAAVSAGDRAFVPFLAAGYPDLAASEAALWAVAEAGADAVEVGVPFGDSLADGPVVQGAYHAALAGGTTVARVLELVSRLKRRGFPPVVLMVAYNLIHRAGLEEFAARARDAGADALLPPDLPVEEWPPLAAALEKAGLDGIRLVAPTTPAARLGRILEAATGFVYYVSQKGVTGARDHLPAGLAAAVTAVRRQSDLPVVVGFGISTPEQAATVGRVADGLVVGSALVRTLDADGRLDRLSALATELRRALRGLGPNPPLDCP